MKNSYKRVATSLAAVPVTLEGWEERLWRWNMAALVLQTVTGALVFGLTDYDAKAPVFTFFPAPRNTTTPWTYEAKHVGNFPVGAWSGVFLFLSAADHAYAVIWRRAYWNNQKARRNPARWLEYSVSASLMHVMVAQLCGVMDLHLLLAIFGLTAACMVCGFLQEISTGHWFPFAAGCWPWVVQWAIIAAYFGVAAERSNPPTFVYAIIVVEIVLDSLFALAMIYQQWVHSDERYVWGELLFIILSFTAKQALAWINLFGTRALPKPVA